MERKDVDTLPRSLHLFIYICLYGFVNVNNGKNGNQECKGRVEGFKVKTIDTTGAGDAFVGSLLVSLAKDKSLYQVS